MSDRRNPSLVAGLGRFFLFQLRPQCPLFFSKCDRYAPLIPENIYQSVLLFLAQKSILSLCCEAMDLENKIFSVYTCWQEIGLAVFGVTLRKESTQGGYCMQNKRESTTFYIYACCRRKPGLICTSV
jgi:hypothetical protein